MAKSLKRTIWTFLILFGMVAKGSALTITPQPPITAPVANESSANVDQVTASSNVTEAMPVSTAPASTTELQQKDIVFPGITASNLTLVNTSDSIWRQAMDNRPSPWKGVVLMDSSDIRTSVRTSTSSFPASHLTSSWSTTPRTVVFLPNPTQTVTDLPPIYLSPSTPGPTTSYPRPTAIPVPYGDGQQYRNSPRMKDSQNYEESKSGGDNPHPNRYNANPNRYNTNPNRYNEHPNQYNAHPNRYNEHPNQQNMHPNRDSMRSNQAYVLPNRDNMPPNWVKIHPNHGNQAYGDSREHPMTKHPFHGRNMAVGKSYSGTPPATFSISSAPLGPSMPGAPSYGPGMPMAPSYGSSMSGSGPSYSATKVTFPPGPPMSPMSGGAYGPQGGATGSGYEASYSHNYGSALGGGHPHMMGYGAGAHDYGGYVTPKEDFGLKGLFSKLLTLIPIGLLLAVALPSLIVIPSRRSISDPTSGRGVVESYPILDMISYYGVDSLQDDKCMRHILCETVRMGSHQGANVFQKHLWSVVRWMDEGMAKRMGMRNLWADIVQDECTKYKCQVTKKTKSILTGD